MNLTVTGRHLEITPAIRDYAAKRLSKLPKYFDRLRSIDVIATCHNHNRYEIEVKAVADRAEPFLAKVQSNDLYACIDQAVDKLERQLTDHKEMVRRRKGKTSMAG